MKSNSKKPPTGEAMAIRQVLAQIDLSGWHGRPFSLQWVRASGLKKGEVTGRGSLVKRGDKNHPKSELVIRHQKKAATKFRYNLKKNRVLLLWDLKGKNYLSIRIRNIIGFNGHRVHFPEYANKK